MKPRAIAGPGILFDCIPCYVLNNGVRAVTAEGMVQFLTGSAGGWNRLVSAVPPGFSIRDLRIEFLDRKRMRAVGMDAQDFADLVHHCAVTHHDPSVVDRCKAALVLMMEAGLVAFEELPPSRLDLN